MPESSVDPCELGQNTLLPSPPLAERGNPRYWLDRAGLGSLAGPLEEMLRPFAWLGAQALLVLQPTLSLFGAGSAVAQLADRWATGDAPPGPPAPVTEEEPCR